MKLANLKLIIILLLPLSYIYGAHDNGNKAAPMCDVSKSRRTDAPEEMQLESMLEAMELETNVDAKRKADDSDQQPKAKRQKHEHAAASIQNDGQQRRNLTSEQYKLLLQDLHNELNKHYDYKTLKAVAMNAIQKYGLHPDDIKLRFGDNCLYNAVNEDDIDFIQFLLAHGASPNSKSLFVPFIFSAQSIAAAQLLIKHGASVNAVDKNGRTLLHITARSDYYTSGDLVNFYIAQGADVTAIDRNGKTVLMDLIDCYRTNYNKKQLEKAPLLVLHGVPLETKNKLNQTWQTLIQKRIQDVKDKKEIEAFRQLQSTIEEAIKERQALEAAAREAETYLTTEVTSIPVELIKIIKSYVLPGNQVVKNSHQGNQLPKTEGISNPYAQPLVAQPLPVAALAAVVAYATVNK